MKSNYSTLVIKDSKGIVTEAIIDPTVNQIKDMADKYWNYRCYSQGTNIIFDAR